MPPSYIYIYIYIFLPNRTTFKMNFHINVHKRSTGSLIHRAIIFTTNITTFLVRLDAVSTGLLTVVYDEKKEEEEEKEQDEDEEEKIEKSLERITDERDGDDDDGGMVLVVTVERAFNVAFANWKIKLRL